MTQETVWVAIATYAPDDDVPPLCAVAITFQEAAEQIDNVIHEHCKGTGVDEEQWIAHDPVERPVLPSSAPSGRATGAKAWEAAGIPVADIDLWFENKIEEIRDCAKDLAHEEADRMTAEDFREDFLFDGDDDDDGEDDE